MSRPKFALLAFLVLTAASLPLWPAVAGPNAGGVLLVHANTSLVYSSDAAYCDQSDLEACSEAVTRVPWEPGTPTVFFVIAAFPDTSQPRLKGLSWGVEWDDAKLVLVDHGSCADFEVADGGWPGSRTGIGQSFTETRTGLLNELYWFAGYAYGAEADSTSFAVITHPRHGGEMVDDAVPAVADSVVGYGTLGFGRKAGVVCPSVAEGEADGEGNGDGDDVPEGGTALVDIRPHSIYRQGGRWAFLVTGLDRQELASVEISGGPLSVLPSEYRDVGAGRVLCLYDYPDIPNETTAEVTVRSQDGLQKTFPLTVKELEHPTEEERNYSVDARLRTATIDWIPVSRGGPYRFVERDLREVTIHDTLMAVVLSGLQTRYVHKVHPDLADGDSVLTSRRGSTLVVPPEQRSLYSFTLPPEIPNTAMAEALLECPSVLDAWANRSVVIPRSYPCDSDITDP